MRATTIRGANAFDVTLRFTQIFANKIDHGHKCALLKFHLTDDQNLRALSTSDNRRDPFNQHSDRSDREKRTTSKGGPVFSKLLRLDRTDPLSFGPKFPEILVEWIAPKRSKFRYDHSIHS